ncbi:Carbonic anhydrase 6, partial [Eschrichtius robustus]|nr:Carbonic anhydrase 6 [Eschrichtius robustus]
MSLRLVTQKERSNCEQGLEKGANKLDLPLGGPAPDLLVLGGKVRALGQVPVQPSLLIQISLPPTMRVTAADGTQYAAQQMHFHRGGASLEISGSEHTIDGIRYVIEIHVVHYNSKYKSYAKAQKAPDGLAVQAALVEVKGNAENAYYSNFISCLKNIRYP